MNLYDDAMTMKMFLVVCFRDGWLRRRIVGGLHPDLFDHSAPTG